jgi:hypothetical protein
MKIHCGDSSWAKRRSQRFCSQERFPFREGRLRPRSRRATWD